MSQLGRIGGQVLTDNLLRAGVDLAFQTDLLYLDVTNRKISIRDATPIYDFDVATNIKTTDLTVVTQLAIGNLRVNSPNTFSTSTGGIDVYINGSDLFHDRLITANLQFDGNLISSFSNSNIVLDPNGSGTVELLADTNITGDLNISGNTNIIGNLTGASQLILGDRIFDTVTINVDFTQSIIPGDDLTYTMGWDAGDSSPRRWAQIHSPEWQHISNGSWDGSGLKPLAVTVSSQTTIDGVANKISAIQSNEDIRLLPDSGITYIESTEWQDNDITNLLDTPLTLVGTGIGYTLFSGTNGMIIPAGPTSDRRLTPEQGETRWNTDLGYLECYDGTVWAVSTGGGEEVTEEIMQDFSHVYTLMLG